MSPKRRTAAPKRATMAKAHKKKSASKRKRTASRGRKSGHRVSDLILKTVSESHEPKGVSEAALRKALAAGGYDVKKNSMRIKLALRSLVNKGSLLETDEPGAHGLFKVNTDHMAKKASKRHGTRTKRAAPRKAAAKKHRAKGARKKVKMARRVKKRSRKGKKPAGKKMRKRLRKKRAKAVKH